VQVWTNTCCSHQLHGQDPDEVDDVRTVAAGATPGALAAAARKLEHELGVPQATTRSAHAAFLTRLVYCAADAAPGTNPAAPPQPTGWGEHEMDYIVFMRCGDRGAAHAPAAPPLDPNPDEVAEVRWVTRAELSEMMAPASGLRWSPWFRIIAERFLQRWWGDLAGVFAGRHADWGSIHNVLPSRGSSA
jgi:isopentenyl-diphosphate Delta-isomerase